MRPVVNTEKHYVQASLGSVTAGNITNIEIVKGVAAPTTALHVREGALVSAIYVEMWITTDDATRGSTIVTLEKRPGAGTAVAMNAAQSAALHDYPNKKNIFHCQMGLTPDNTQFPMASIKGWFKIPKGKQRMGLDDKIYLNIHAQSNGVSFCGFFTYKEQF